MEQIPMSLLVLVGIKDSAGVWAEPQENGIRYPLT